jgi:hypothetical protein
MRFVRVFVGVLALGLVGVVGAGPAGAGAQVQGVTDDEIQIVVLVADVDALRAGGISLSPQLTNENILRRAQGFADEFGPINGRKVVFKAVGWDPIDATTFDRACTEATQDNQPFLVINGNGYRADSIPCLTVDNKTPVFIGESVYGDIQKASRKNLLSLALPSEVNGVATANLAQKAELIDKTSTIGIISSNEPGRKLAADALEARLDKLGFEVAERVEINSLQADVTAANRESTAAVEPLKQAGVDTVFVAISPTTSTGYFQEVTRTNPGFESYLVDVAGAACTTFSAPRLPAEVNGIPCITTYDTRAVPTKDGIKPDNAFEAKCRSQYADITGWTPYPGAQSGGTDVDGMHWDEDIPYQECTMMNVLLPALKAAGKNLTWDKVYANLLKRTKAPMAYMSGGTGGFGKNKPYLATQVHLETMSAVPAGTPLDANGKTYNGCPVPKHCFVPQVIDGQEWFAADSSE